MKLRFSREDEKFRAEVVSWLSDNLTDEFEQLKFRGRQGDEHMVPEERKKRERKLAERGWNCIGWSKEYGCRGCSIGQQVIFHEQ
mgnify:CR=1 FL=1